MEISLVRSLDYLRVPYHHYPYYINAKLRLEQVQNNRRGFKPTHGPFVVDMLVRGLCLVVNHLTTIEYPDAK